jgi:hypothetical protein
MESRKLYPILTYAGMLPFIGCALMPLVGLQELWNLGSYDYIAASYGLAWRPLGHLPLQTRSCTGQSLYHE